MFWCYSLALRWNLVGQSAAASALAMMAGGPVNGGLKDTHIVTKWEHKAAAAHRVVSQDFYDLVCNTQGAAARYAPGRAASTSVEIVQYMGDATHQEAICKSKMHLATVSTLVCSGRLWSSVQSAADAADFDTEVDVVSFNLG